MRAAWLLLQSILPLGLMMVVLVGLVESDRVNFIMGACAFGLTVLIVLTFLWLQVVHGKNQYSKGYRNGWRQGRDLEISRRDYDDGQNGN